MNIREPVVAGKFYPKERKILNKTLTSLMTDNPQKDIKGIMMPHAGYIYSGKTAGIAASSIKNADRVIILGPKHTPNGAMGAVSPCNIWRTPLGDVKIDRELADKIAMCHLLESDKEAHLYEHSIEVLLPFLQKNNPDIKIVPIAINFHKIEILKEIAEHILSILKSLKKVPVIVISSDMSHYINAEEAGHQDRKAIDKMIDLDAEKLFNTVISEKISMCGFIPATLALMLLKELGAKKGILLSYTNSGETSGDFSQVVSYAGMIFK